MIRENLYRGKSVDGKRWLYGDLIQCLDVTPPRYAIIPQTKRMCVYTQYEVIPETIGQFTGELDKNGTKIFEEDVCKDGIYGEQRIVFYENGRWSWMYWEDPEEWEVICNIHDNK